VQTGDVPVLLAVFLAGLVALVTLWAVVRARRAARGAESARQLAVGRAEQAETRAARVDTAVAELLDLLAVGTVRLDRDLVVELINDSALQALDRPRRRVVGRPAFEAFADQHLVDLVETARTAGSAHGEVTRGGPDGRILVGRARRSTSGELWLTLEDVSELRRLQRIRAEFIDNLSHELRTPLTSLGLLAETLARDVEAAAAAGTPVTPRMRERLGKIELETGHLTQMVTEMLELSRIEAGGPPPTGILDEVDMARLVSSSTERLRTFADRSGVRLRVEVPPDSAVAVLGDEDRLGQVLLNLLHNAIKFSPSGAEVVIHAERDAQEVVTSVIDHGIGIPREAQVRIFERFYKVDRARARGEGGTGLGLAIARHIVETHGGRIWVESREGVGSTFSFALPAVVPTRDRASPVPV
jgi:two-component system phosphate regulon sensor histidine kinase PhoR